MERERYREMMMGLLQTAEEKVHFLGYEKAKPELSKILNIVSLLEAFWSNGGEGFFNEDWLDIFQIKIDELSNNA